MTDTKNPVTGLPIPGKNTDYIAHGSKAHIAMVEEGYGMDKAEATEIIADREKNSGTPRYPYDSYKKAKQFMQALQKPTVASPRQAWKRVKTR